MSSICEFATYDGYNDHHLCIAPWTKGIPCPHRTPDPSKCNDYKKWEEEEKVRIDNINKVGVCLVIDTAENLSHVVLALAQSGYKIGVRSKENTSGFVIEIDGVELVNPQSDPEVFIYTGDGRKFHVTKDKEKDDE